MAKNTFTRDLKHIANFKGETQGSLDVSYSMKGLKGFMVPLTRQVNEAVLIEHSTAHWTKMGGHVDIFILRPKINVFSTNYLEIIKFAYINGF